MKCFALLVGLALAVTISHVSAAPSGRAGAMHRLQHAGYQIVQDLERKGPLWEADVVRQDGSFGEVVLDPSRDEIFDAGNGRILLSTVEVVGRLKEQGYRMIESIDRDGAVWEVEATNAKGQRVELTISGYDGRVLRSERDYDFFPDY